MKETIPYGRWWLINAGASSTVVLLFFTLRFATWEYSDIGMIMGLMIGLLPAAMAIALGSLVFLITKAVLQKRSIPTTRARACILGPMLVFVTIIGCLAAWQTSGQQRWKQLVGDQLPTAKEIRIVGCSGFLAGDWLAICRMDSADFAKLVRIKELKPLESVDLNTRFSRGLLSSNRLVQSLSTWTNSNIRSFEHVYLDEHGRERGSFFAAHDAARSTAIIARSYHD